MEHEELTRKIDAYLEENWETMVEDIETLVRIPSFEESDKATEGAPFGPGPKEALEAALEMPPTWDSRRTMPRLHRVRRLPRQERHAAGHHRPHGRGSRRSGWNFEPYAVTRKEGYLSVAARSTTRAPAWWRCTP